MSWQGHSWWCLSMAFLQRFHFTMKGCGRWRSDECNVTCSHPTRGSLIIFLGCEKSKCKFYPLHMYLMFNVFFAFNYRFTLFGTMCPMYITLLNWISCIWWAFLQIFHISHTCVLKSISQLSHVCLHLASWFINDHDYINFVHFVKIFNIFVACSNNPKHCQTTSYVLQKQKSLKGAC